MQYKIIAVLLQHEAKSRLLPWKIKGSIPVCSVRLPVKTDSVRYSRNLAHAQTPSPYLEHEAKHSS